MVVLDYAGPLYLRDDKKGWVCLFTCAVYRAVHLELVTSLSTAAFLESLRRFIARRGRPTTIYSDNGTNFVGACNLLKSVNWNKIGSYCSAEKIEWRFNPPSATLSGGVDGRSASSEFSKIFCDVVLAGRRYATRRCIPFFMNVNRLLMHGR